MNSFYCIKYKLDSIQINCLQDQYKVHFAIGKLQLRSINLVGNVCVHILNQVEFIVLMHSDLQQTISMKRRLRSELRQVNAIFLQA